MLECAVSHCWVKLWFPFPCMLHSERPLVASALHAPCSFSKHSQVSGKSGIITGADWDRLLRCLASSYSEEKSLRLLRVPAGAMISETPAIKHMRLQSLHSNENPSSELQEDQRESWTKTSIHPTDRNVHWKF